MIEERRQQLVCAFLGTVAGVVRRHCANAGGAICTKKVNPLLPELRDLVFVTDD
jgi:hypothetical protein